MLIELYEWVHQIAGLFCHQIPDRSLFIGGAQFPLCIRCTSLLVGAASAVIYLSAHRPLPSIRLCIAMVLPMTTELVLQMAGMVSGSNLLRAITAILFGFFLLIGTLVALAGLEPEASR